MQEITYMAHVAEKGWLDPVPAGSIAGTVGQGRAMEAFRIVEHHVPNLGITGNAYVQNIEWAEHGIEQGQDVGTTGLGLHIEAVRLDLYGEAAKDYTIWYRLHVAEFGFLPWSRNGEVNGTAGGNIQAEAIQIILVRNDENFWPANDYPDPFIDLTPKVNKADWVIEQAKTFLGYISEGGSDYSIFGEGDWCCKFVRLLYENAGVTFPNTDWVPTVQEWAIQNGRWTNTPQKGYAVIFDFNGNGNGDHIGLVEEGYSPDHCKSIEGNTDQGNGIGVYEVDRSYGILGYVNPF